MYGHIRTVAPARTKPTLPQVLRASSWGTLFDQVWSRVLAAHGGGMRSKVPSADTPAPSPRLTNGEAITVIAAWHFAATHRFPLWYQYAAVAYGWDPETDAIDTTSEQAARAYMPEELNAALWDELFAVAMALSAEQKAGENTDPPRLELDVTLADPVFAGLVAAQLKQDGADAAFKIPTGICKDPRTGKRRLYRPCPPGAKRGADGRSYYKDPITGAMVPCDGKGDCTPVLIDDPVTKIGKDVITLALILGAVWWIAKRKPSRRTRRMTRS